jgi:hypothetical protein
MHGVLGGNLKGKNRPKGAERGKATRQRPLKGPVSHRSDLYLVGRESQNGPGEAASLLVVFVL